MLSGYATHARRGKRDSSPPHVDSSTESSESTRSRVVSEDSVEVWAGGC